MHRSIESRQGLYGTVLNVFDRAVNIRSNDDMLLVVSLGQVASPITMNIISCSSAVPSEVFTGLVHNGDQVLVARRSSSADTGIAGTAQIMLGRRCAILVNKPVRFFENFIPKPKLENLLKFIDYREQLMAVLRECAKDRAGSLLNPDATTEALLPEFMSLIRGYTSDIKSPEFEANLSKHLLGLCGRGPGFTPAGDDFIAGVLSVLNWIRSGLNIGAPIIPSSDYRKLTTWTSFRLMECNSQGLLDAEVQELINTVADGDVSRYADSTRWIAKRGHTSGIDFATGATTAIYLFLDGLRHK